MNNNIIHPTLGRNHIYLLAFVFLMLLFAASCQNATSPSDDDVNNATKMTSPDSPSTIIDTIINNNTDGSGDNTNTNISNANDANTTNTTTNTTNNGDNQSGASSTSKKNSSKPTKKTENVKSAEVVNTRPAQLGTFSKDYLMGKFDPNTHPDFTTIKAQHASRKGMRLRQDAYAAFVKMYNAAQKDGIRLKIISATRPFNHQKRIWEAKWNGQRKVDGRYLPGTIKDPVQRAYLILRYSSMPGTSRHHWGTDIDLNDLNNSYFATGTGKKVYDWLVKNAHLYGYCQVYSPKGDDRQWGYEEEKWHWSYLPVAQVLTQQYKNTLTNQDISGFEGANTAVEIDMKTKYVLGINPKCL